MDNLLTGDVANVEHLTGRDFVLVKHNVTSYIALEGPLDQHPPLREPGLPHRLPARAHPDPEGRQPGHAQRLGLAKAKNARFLLASTSEVYGDPLVHPQREDYWGNVNPVGPRGVYDEAKRFAEAMVMAYHRVHGVHTRIVRIFNTYGPRMRVEDGRAIPAFMSQALRGEDLTVFGDGSQTRSLCYVSDLVEGIFRLMASDHADPVNIGNPEELTIRRWPSASSRSAAPRAASSAPAARRRSQGPPARHHEGAEAPGLGAEGVPRSGPAEDARVLPEEAGAVASRTTVTGRAKDAYCPVTTGLLS